MSPTFCSFTALYDHIAHTEKYIRRQWLETTRQLETSLKKVEDLKSKNEQLTSKLIHLQDAYRVEVKKNTERSEEASHLRQIINQIREYVVEDPQTDKHSPSVHSSDSLLGASHISKREKVLSILRSESWNSHDQPSFECPLPQPKTGKHSPNEIDENDEELLFDQSESILASFIKSPDNEIKSSLNRDKLIDSKNRLKEGTHKDTPIRPSAVNDFRKQPVLTTIESDGEDEMREERQTRNNYVDYNSNRNFTPSMASSPRFMLPSSASINHTVPKQRISFDPDRLDVRPHSLQVKKAFKPLTCTPCLKSIGFCVKYLACSDCRTLCHVACQANLSLPCIPHFTPKGVSRNGSRMLVADFTCPTTRPFVPPILVHCCKEIEKRGLHEVGLYRKCGSDREVRELKEKFLSSKNGAPNIKKCDVHVLCGVVKMFLRTLDDPIITRVLWHDFVRAAGKCPTKLCII